MKPALSEVHPELRKMAGKIPSFSFTSRNLRILRFLSKFPWVRKIPKDIFITSIYIPDLDQKAQVRLCIYRPKPIASPLPVLIWLHGGGYVIGKPEQDDQFCIRCAGELGCLVVSVDYRLAPKHSFPTPLEDAYCALTWVDSHASMLGIDPKRIAIGGQSAGAGLAAALAQFTHELGEVRPVFQLMVYPMLDDRTPLRTELADRRYFIWNQESNRFGWESYLGQKCGQRYAPPYSVPARCENLAGLPPAWIGVGTLDLFHDEDMEYVRRLQEHGVACELVVIPGAFHAFDILAPRSQVAQDFRDSQIAALKRAFGV